MQMQKKLDWAPSGHALTPTLLWTQWTGLQSVLVVEVISDKLLKDPCCRFWIHNASWSICMGQSQITIDSIRWTVSSMPRKIHVVNWSLLLYWLI